VERPSSDRKFLAIRFKFFKFDLEFLKRVQSFSALNIQIYLITIGIGK
jgi:hypothetical protein